MWFQLPHPPDQIHPHGLLVNDWSSLIDSPCDVLEVYLWRPSNASTIVISYHCFLFVWFFYISYHCFLFVWFFYPTCCCCSIIHIISTLPSVKINLIPSPDPGIGYFKKMTISLSSGIWVFPKLHFWIPNLWSCFS